MNPYEPILQEIARDFLGASNIKPNFSNSAMLDATVIFQTVFMDKMFDTQNYDGMSFEDRAAMAKKGGEELRKLIYSFTGLDTFVLAESR